MRYVEIDGVRVDVEDCEGCPLNYDNQCCLHPNQCTLVGFDWFSGPPPFQICVHLGR